MRINPALLLIILLSSSNVFACECVNVFDTSFMGNTARFDFIVKGKIDKVDLEFVSLKIEEAYKGAISGDNITLFRGGPDCMHYLDFKHGDTIIIGLVRSYYHDDPLAYMAPGCVTSAVYIKGEQAFAPEVQPPLFKQPKITMFRNRMKLSHFERELKP